MKGTVIATMVFTLAVIAIAVVVCFFLLVALDGFQERDTFGSFVLYGVGSAVLIACGAAVCYLLTDFLMKRGRGVFVSAAIAVVATFVLAVPAEFALLFGGVLWAESNRKSHISPIMKDQKK